MHQFPRASTAQSHRMAGAASGDQHVGQSVKIRNQNKTFNTGGTEEAEDLKETGGAVQLDSSVILLVLCGEARKELEPTEGTEGNREIGKTAKPNDAFNVVKCTAK